MEEGVFVPGPNLKLFSCDLVAPHPRERQKSGELYWPGAKPREAKIAVWDDSGRDARLEEPFADLIERQIAYAKAGDCVERNAELDAVLTSLRAAVARIETELMTPN